MRVQAALGSVCPPPQAFRKLLCFLRKIDTGQPVTQYFPCPGSGRTRPLAWCPQGMLPGWGSESPLATQSFRRPLCGPVPRSPRRPLQGESSTGKETVLERWETWSQGCRGPETPKRISRTPLTGRPACSAAGPCGPSTPRPRDGVRGALMATSELTSLTCTSVSVTLPTILTKMPSCSK